MFLRFLVLLVPCVLAALVITSIIDNPWIALPLCGVAGFFIGTHIDDILAKIGL